MMCVLRFTICFGANKNYPTNGVFLLTITRHFNDTKEWKRNLSFCLFGLIYDKKQLLTDKQLVSCTFKTTMFSLSTEWSHCSLCKAGRRLAFMWFVTKTNTAGIEVTFTVKEVTRVSGRGQYILVSMTRMYGPASLFAWTPTTVIRHQEKKKRLIF